MMVKAHAEHCRTSSIVVSHVMPCDHGIIKVVGFLWAIWETVTRMTPQPDCPLQTNIATQCNTHLMCSKGIYRWQVLQIAP